MKMRFHLYVLIISLFVTSCDSYFEELEGIDYSIGWINMPELTTLYYNYPDGSGSVGLMEGFITDVYWNKKYIIAKQCNVHCDSILGYYVIELLPPVEKGVPWKKSGPLSEKEYEKTKQNLFLNEFEHINIIYSYTKDIVYKDLLIINITPVLVLLLLKLRHKRNTWLSLRKSLIFDIILFVVFLFIYILMGNWILAVKFLLCGQILLFPITGFILFFLSLDINWIKNNKERIFPIFIKFLCLILLGLFIYFIIECIFIRGEI